MAQATRELAGIVGREAELSVLDAFLGSDGATRAFVVTGEPGIGKTTVWEAAVRRARARGLRVLAARASGADTRLPFAALIDLLDAVGEDELAALPPPQRRALEVALYRAEPTGAPPEPHAIALAVLNALRSLATRGPLLVAVDDTQWLDRASEVALTYALRRLDGEERACFLLARRPGAPSELERVLEPRGLERLDLGPPSLGAIRRVLAERLGLSLPRQVMRQLYEATLGNPLFALEVGRKVVEDGLPRIGDDLPVPDAVEDLLGTRVAALPDGLRAVLLAVALSGTLPVSQLRELAEPGAVDAAAERGLLTLDGHRARPSHPLLAAVVLRHSPAAERRLIHRALADVVGPGELRTRHLALAADRPDPVLAAEVASAAAAAGARGAPQAAVELAEHALRLTPQDHADRPERVLELGRYLVYAGQKRRVTELLTGELESIPPGPTRAKAFLLLTRGEIGGNDDIHRYQERALAESGSDVEVRAWLLADMAENVAAVRVESIAEAEAWAVEALPETPGAEPDLERRVLYALAWTRCLGGRSIEDMCERFHAASPTAFYIAYSPERVAAQRLVWRGAVAEARAVLTRQLAAADERGEPSSYALQRLHLCELELRAGNWSSAERLLDEWSESTDRELLHWPMYERCRALDAAGRGLVDDARRWGAEAHERARARGVRWDQLESLRALGTADLLAHDTERAAESLRTVWMHTEREGVRDPGTFPVAPELVEALVQLGERDEAVAVTTRLRELAEDQDHPWGIATARRCAALAELAEDYDEGAVAALERSAREYAELGLAFDEARSLLALGRAQRRFRKWGAARETLERAVAAFDHLGSSGWAAAARSELDRVGARRPARVGGLTPTERRVAELAAEGLTNKEIARALVVTVSTVEFHLSNAYTKLGIRSRAQLAGRLVEPVESSE